MENTQSMKEAFDYLKFFTMVKHNLTQDELISLSHFIANYPLPKSCRRFVLTFPGHGGDGFIYSEDEKRVTWLQHLLHLTVIILWLVFLDCFSLIYVEVICMTKVL